MSLTRGQQLALMQAQVVEADDLAFDLGAAVTLPEFSTTFGQVGQLGSILTVKTSSPVAFGSDAPAPNNVLRNVFLSLGGILVIGLVWKAVSD